MLVVNYTFTFTVFVVTFTFTVCCYIYSCHIHVIEPLKEEDGREQEREEGREKRDKEEEEEREEGGREVVNYNAANRMIASATPIHTAEVIDSCDLSCDHRSCLVI